MNDLSTASTSITTMAGEIPQTPTELQDPSLDTLQDKMFVFSEAEVHLKRLIDDWHTEIEDTEVRRKTRDVEIDVEGLRQKGDIDQDETIIPVRVIDTNIQRELPAFVNYLKNSRRLCTFRSLDNPTQDPQLIEKEFTEGMTYSGWEKPHFKCLDGADTHGWACVEVVFDESKPLNVAIEYVAHDELFWPRTVKNIQESPRMVRAYDVTVIKLKEWVRKFGFDPVQVDTLVRPIQDTQKENETRRIYKLMFKKEGIVYVAWFALTDGVNDWLKKPEQLFVGIYEQQMVQTMIPDLVTGMPMPTMQPQMVEAPVVIYPFFKLPYRETEKPKEVDSKGRVFLDENKQEAQTAILSGFVNGITRASNLYGSPKQDDGTGSSIKELENVKLCGGRLLNRPIEFWSPPYPNAMIVQALQFMDVSNSQETNQPTFAAINREDSRKTAREMTIAQQQQTKIDSVQLTNYSTFIREIYSFAWLIVQSQALLNKIKFLLKAVPNQFGGEPIFQNDVKVISQKWELRAAGDVDVIQRQEKIQMMMQDWPVVGNTPLAMRFLMDLMRLKYPDVGDQYAMILQAGDPRQMVIALGTIVSAMITQHPEILQTVPPEQQQQLSQLLQMAQAMAQQGQQQQGQQQQQNEPPKNIQSNNGQSSQAGTTGTP